jgi:hypothetical protein
MPFRKVGDGHLGRERAREPLQSSLTANILVSRGSYGGAVLSFRVASECFRGSVWHSLRFPRGSSRCSGGRESIFMLDLHNVGHRRVASDP